MKTIGAILFLSLCAGIASGAGFDLTSVPISHVVNLYFKEATKKPYVVCADVLQDMRTVSIRADSASLKPAIVAGLLASHGYEVSEINGVSVVCKKALAESSTSDRLETVMYKPQYRTASWLVDIAVSVVGGSFANQRQAKVATRVGGERNQDALNGQLNADEDDFVLFQGTNAQAQQLRDLLRQIDTPSGEVIVKAHVYEVSKATASGSALQMIGSLLSSRLQLELCSPTLSNSLRFNSGDMNAVFSVLDSDSRFKMVTSPYARVRSGSHARFSVGQDVPVLGAIVNGGQGLSQQSVEYRSSGVIFDVSPVVHSSAIDIDVYQQISSFIRTETGLNDTPTLNKREIRTSLSIQPGQVVVLGGLNETKDDFAKSGVRLLPFNFSKASSLRETELLLFLEVMPIQRTPT